MIITQFFTILAEQVNFYFVGNLNNVEQLAGVGIANMMINILAFSTMFGMNSALGTFVSQAYGARNHKMCGEILWRGRAMMIAMYLVIVVILGFAE